MPDTPALEILTGSERGAPVESARVESTKVIEIHLGARPDGPAIGFERQARSMYERLLAGLCAHGATARDVVAERVFLSDIGRQAPRLAAIRHEIYGDPGSGSPHPATTWVGQPPARSGLLCELQALALLGADGDGLPSRNVEGLPAEGSGRIVDEDGVRHLFLSGVTGGLPGDRLDAASQASAAFLRAEAVLNRAGFSFREVVRTWIFLADIGGDYAALNRERRRFFTARGIAPPPASTAIGGVPCPPDRALGIDLRAISGTAPPRVTALHSPTMNEAPSYGSDFSRGMRIDLVDRSILHVSGTASIDTDGRVVHARDIAGQVERMLQNIEALLAGQEIGYDHVVSAVTYLKRSDDVETFRRVAARHGLPSGIPNTLCLAEVCRPEWLCEMEVTAVRA
ncbi:MAG TPA: RidA family protein [Candidatus Polarisedimenticolia bacterium]|nr:RidA family protein [Candidatus Polarisedimenticolia bacterium]